MNPYINMMLRLNNTEPFNNVFDQMGYNSMFLSNNLGTLNLVFLFYLVGLLVMHYYKRLKSKSRVAKRRYRWIKRLLVHNFIITTIMESYSNIAVCSFISLYYVRWRTWGETI